MNKKQIKVGFSQYDKDMLEDAAKKRGMSVSRFIRELVLSVTVLMEER